MKGRRRKRFPLKVEEIQQAMVGEACPLTKQPQEEKFCKTLFGNLGKDNPSLWMKYVTRIHRQNEVEGFAKPKRGAVHEILLD